MNKNIQNQNCAELEKVNLSLGSDGILRVIYQKEVKIELDIIQQIFAMAVDIVSNGKIYFLVDTAQSKGMTKAAYQFIQQTELLSKVGGIAILVNSMAGKVIGNFSTKVYPAACQRKLFEKEREAIKWLEQLMEINLEKAKI